MQFYDRRLYLAFVYEGLANTIPNRRERFFWGGEIHNAQYTMDIELSLIFNPKKCPERLRQELHPSKHNSGFGPLAQVL